MLLKSGHVILTIMQDTCLTTVNKKTVEQGKARNEYRFKYHPISLSLIIRKSLHALHEWNVAYQLHFHPHNPGQPVEKWTAPPHNKVKTQLRRIDSTTTAIGKDWRNCERKQRDNAGGLYRTNSVLPSIRSGIEGSS